MIVLDSDHLSVLQRDRSLQRIHLQRAIDESRDETFATTVISLEEHLRGWLAAIRRARSVEKQIISYQELLNLVAFFGRWTVLPFDKRAAQQFANLRKEGVRIGTMDLKIAAIVMTHDALLLSANLRDFEKVSGLEVKDWLS